MKVSLSLVPSSPDISMNMFRSRGINIHSLHHVMQVSGVQVFVAQPQALVRLNVTSMSLDLSCTSALVQGYL
jgi:hypothetical protein